MPNPSRMAWENMMAKHVRPSYFPTSFLDVFGTCALLQWKYKNPRVKYFDTIEASPPCTEYSIGKQTGVRKIEQANEII
jgi:hypothetical protein